jgi:hypothetical protein
MTPASGSVILLLLTACGLGVRSLTWEPSQAEQRLVGCYSVESTPTNYAARRFGVYVDTMWLDAELFVADSGPPPGRWLHFIRDDSTRIATHRGYQFWRLSNDSLLLYAGYGLASSEITAVMSDEGFRGRAVHETDNILPDSAGLELWPYRYDIVGSRIPCPAKLQGGDRARSARNGS